MLSPAALADVLQTAGVQFDTSMPVVYASACPFHGRRVPHLVVQTTNGPMTVMLLAHEKVASRQEFSEGGYHGVLLPAGEGSVAVLMQNGASAGRGRDAGGQRGSLVASTSQPDCGSAKQRTQLRQPIAHLLFD